jgi:hypothetical protein
MEMTRKKTIEKGCSKGSAFILAIVLVSLLAIIGTMFLMTARLNRMSTSSLAESKNLDFAVESVAAEISQHLVLDTPGVNGNHKCYNYPDVNNTWLASLEPYKLGGNYYWRHISDVNGALGINANNLPNTIIGDYQDASKIGDSNTVDSYPADADGDGVADSKWIRLKNVSSSKGKPVYAAIRVIDNGAMLNVNTARQFYYTANGSTQTDVNLLSLAIRGSTPNPLGKLDDARFGFEPLNLNNYIRDVIWRYEGRVGKYTPFDIGDELELRNRFVVRQVDTKTRIKNLWADVFEVGMGTPFDSSNVFKWPEKVTCIDVNSCDYRHIATTYNMDRVIDPNGIKMANVNKATADELYHKLRQGILDVNSNYQDGSRDVNAVAAQMAVNIVDYRDIDSSVTVYHNLDDGKYYYGFERPCIYLSEFACRIKQDTSDPNKFYMSYAVELYNPYGDVVAPNEWKLVIDGKSYNISWLPNTKKYHVIKWQALVDPCVPLDVNHAADPCQVYDNPDAAAKKIFDTGSKISLTRNVGGTDITVDSNSVPSWLVSATDGSELSLQRDITKHKCIRRVWDQYDRLPTLGKENEYPKGIDPCDPQIQAHPANEDFNNIGEIGMVLRREAYEENLPKIGPSDTEATVRIDVNNPAFQKIFNYLTVFDPYDFHPGDANYVNETRVKGRININTAPWYVIAQLPWVSQRIGYDSNDLAMAIVAYRDKLDLTSSGGPNYSGRVGEPGFRNIGELNNVVYGSRDYRIDYYALDLNDLTGFPDLTPGDGAADDFEERDLIFARISNLVTVRSDVFTAYILVRIGTDGPQKRMIAIFDRSGVTPNGGKVKIIALHPVPDPR